MDQIPLRQFKLVYIGVSVCSRTAFALVAIASPDHLPLLTFNEVLPKKFYHFSVEIPMKLDAVETRRISANVRPVLRFSRSAGGKKREVFGVCY